ncbi:MAG: hypothetical protein ABIH23_30045 [bacterium]
MTDDPVERMVRYRLEQAAIKMASSQGKDEICRTGEIKEWIPAKSMRE